MIFFGTRLIRGLCGLLLVWSALAASSNAAHAADDWRAWTRAETRPDTLVGRIWVTADQDFISPPDLIARLGPARFVLIGETHDNPDHHQLQGFLIRNIAPAQRPAVVMEMLSADQQPALDHFAGRESRTAEDLFDAVNWAGTGWPPADLYRPVVEAALARGGGPRAGLPDRASTRAVSRAGLTALDGAERAALGLAGPLDPDGGAELKDEIMAAHCDHLPIEALPNMMAVQRYRDAVLARALRQTPATGPAILIAGNGHVRKDRGVPAYLADRKDVVSIVLQEVDPMAAPGDAGPLSRTYPADYVWFTPARERGDPCAGLRARFSGNG